MDPSSIKKPPTSSMSGMGFMGTASSSGNDSYLRDQMEKLFKESKYLKQKVELLERENIALKKSLFELSARYNMCAHHKTQPFVIDSAAIADYDLSGNGTSNGHGGGMNNSSNSNTNGGNMTGNMNGGMVGNNGIEDVGTSANGAAGNVTNNGMDASRDADVYATNTPTTSTSTAKQHKDRKLFYFKHDLKGHQGAVYAVQFSPTGRLLATGSFDKTIRIWDPMSATKEIHCLRKHSLNVSDLCWSNNSQELLSGAYDQTCKIWDVDAGKCIESYECVGFAQCVMFSPRDNAIFFNGTSRKVLCCVDRRKGDTVLVLRNEAMINSLYVHRDGNYVLSADSSGYLKTWDVRTGKCVQSVLNESSKKPISHIALSMGLTMTTGAGVLDFESLSLQDSVSSSSTASSVVGNTGAVRAPSPTSPPVLQDTNQLLGRVEEEPRYLAVNSYDNVVRIYDRQTPNTPKVVQALKGYKNKNWPIKSSFFCFPQSSSMGGGIIGGSGNAGVGSNSGGSKAPFASALGASSSSPSASSTSSPVAVPVASSLPVTSGLRRTASQMDFEHFNADDTMSTGSSSAGGMTSGEKDLMGNPIGSNNNNNNVLLATGSADPYVYVYNVSGGGELVQRLEGHTDRVYAVAFSPVEPVLASVSADFTCKIWGMHSHHHGVGRGK